MDTARRVHNLARAAAKRDLRELHPEEWLKHKQDGRAELSEHLSDADKLAGRARNIADARLKLSYPGQWQLLRSQWVEYYKRELGYRDLRPEANRARHA